MTTCDLQNEYVGMMDINVNAIHNEGLPTVWHLLDSQNLGVMYIKNPHKNFIIGDIPLVKVSDTEIYFSIAPDIMIYWGREHDEPEKKVIQS